MADFIVDPVLRDYLPGVPKQADSDLEADLRVSIGPRERFVIWKEENKLLDGHRRYAICRRLGLPWPDPEYRSFANIEEAKHWMDTNQGLRRNLNETQEAERRVRILVYERLKGGPGATKRTAEQEGVTRQTIYRDEKYVAALESLDEETRKRIKSEELYASKADVQQLATLSATHQTALVALVDS